MRKRILLVSVVVFCASVKLFAQETQVDSDLKFGIELFRNQMYDLAEEQFNKFLQQYPASPSAGQARYYLALSQLDQKKYADAAGNFQTFAIQYPNDPQAPSAWMNAGDAFAKGNDFANAGLSYERLKVFYPKDPQAPAALLEAARFFNMSGDTARAEISLLSIVQDYTSTSSYFEATFQLGNLYFDSGRLQKAENQYKALLASDNDSVRVMGLLALGKLNKMTGSIQSAEQYFAEAAKIGIFPQSTDAVLETIEIDLEAGNYSHGLEDANRLQSSKLTSEEREQLDYEINYAQLALGNNSIYRKNAAKIKVLPWKYRIRIASLLKTKGEFSEGLAVMKNLPAKGVDSSALDLYAELAYRAGKMSLADSLLHLSIQDSKSPDPRIIVKLLDIEKMILNDGEKVGATFARYRDYLKDRPDALLFYGAIDDEISEDYGDASDKLEELEKSFPESDYLSAADSLSDIIADSKGFDYRDAVVELADILMQQGLSSSDKTNSLMRLGNLYENILKDHSKAARIFEEVASTDTGSNQRLANYLLASALEKNEKEKTDRNSKAFDIYQQLSAEPAADSIAERSLFKLMELQASSGDSVAAENSALSFVKRFPASPRLPEACCLLATVLFNSGAYHDAVAQASLATPLPAAALILAKSEIALDSLDNAKSILENLMNSDPPKESLIRGELVYIGLLKRTNADAGETYIDLLDNLVPSKVKDNVAAQYADFLYSTEKYDSAFSVYDLIGKDELWHRTSSQLNYKMAYCMLKTGDLESARDLFQQVASTASDTSLRNDSFLQLGGIYRNLGDSKMSAAFYEKAGSGDEGALVNAGDTYFKLGDFENAQEIYGKLQNSTKSDSVKEYCVARLIEIDYKDGDVKSADSKAAKFRKSYKDGSSEYLARFLVDKAEYLIDNKKYDEAEKLLDDVKSDYEDTQAYPVSLLDHARVFVEKEDLDKAQATLTELLTKFPASAAALEGHLELGNILYAKEKYQEAADNFRMVYLDSLADRGLVRDAMSRLVSSYESLGLFDGALEISRKFVKMFPDDKSIMDMRIKIGILYEELKYFDQALLTFQNLAKDANRDYQAELHYYIGAIYDDKGDYASAILEFLKVPYLVSPSPAVDWAAQAYYSAGKCYEKLNKPNDAITMYQKIVDKPNTDPTFVAGAQREINRVKALLK